MLKLPVLIQKKKDVITKISLKQDLAKVNLPLVSMEERTVRQFLTADTTVADITNQYKYSGDYRNPRALIGREWRHIPL